MSLDSPCHSAMLFSDSSPSKSSSQGDSLGPNVIRATDAAHTNRITDVQWDHVGRRLVWREQVGAGSNLTCWDSKTGRFYKLASGYDVQSRGGNGGGDFGLASDDVYFVSEKRLFRQSLHSGAPVSLTPIGRNPGAPVPSPDGRHVLFVDFSDEADLLASIRRDGEGTVSPVDLDRDFYMQPTWDPRGSQIAWVSWDHSNMPWDGSALYMERFEHPAQGIPRRPLVGEPCGKEAVFQPEFSPDGRFLAFVTDRNGWFNLHVFDLSTQVVRPVWEEEAEFGLAAWSQGMRTYTWSPDGHCIYAIRSREGCDELVRIDLAGGRASRLEGDLTQYTQLQQISISSDTGEIALIASSYRKPPQILLCDGKGQAKVLYHCAPGELQEECFRRPRHVTWPIQSGGGLDRHCNGIYFPPTHPEQHNESLPPALVISHGGPTGQATAAFNLTTQYFTSRGFAVLKVNYRGSSGYGKAYREALHGHWGLLDVEDTLSGADFLLNGGLADPHRLVVEGGSAGGLTALMCLIARPGFFRAAICRYPVTDLPSLPGETHRFERHYLDCLIGPLPEKLEEYRRRSPSSGADQIQDPVALFQGAEDQVVPPSQASRIIESLARRGVPHLFRIYPHEGHGWKRPETVRDYLEAVESFLRTHVLKI